MILAIVGGVVAGALIGAFNGYFYVNRKIKSFIVTICTMFLFRGFIKYMASNSPVAADMRVYDFDKWNSYFYIPMQSEEMCRILNKEQTIIVRKKVLKEMLK